jgi:hypothetical protein
VPTPTGQPHYPAGRAGRVSEAWTDPACLAIRLIAAGHTPAGAETWVRRIPVWNRAPAEEIGTLAQIMCRIWTDIARQDTQRWTQAMVDAARAWAGHRIVDAVG